MIEIDIQFMLDRVAAREKAKECKNCHGRGKIVKPDTIGDLTKYSQECPKCCDNYKLPRKWSLMTDEDVLGLFSLEYNDEQKRTILTKFMQVGILTQERLANIVKLMK